MPGTLLCSSCRTTEAAGPAMQAVTHAQVLIGHAGQTFSLDNSPVTPDFFEVGRGLA